MTLNQQLSSKCLHGHYIPESERATGHSSYCTACQAETGVRPQQFQPTIALPSVLPIAKTFHRWLNATYELNDLIAEGNQVLVEVLNKKPSASQVYLKTAIRNHFKDLLDAALAQKRDAETVSFTDHVRPGDPESLTFADVIADTKTASPEDEAIFQQMVEHLANVLTPFQRTVVELHADGMSHRAIAVELGCDKNKSARAYESARERALAIAV